MMYRSICLISILVSLILVGCSSNSTSIDNFSSEDFRAPKDTATIYIIREFNFLGGGYTPYFTFNDSVVVGEIENNHYIYFYAYPMELVLSKVGGDYLKIYIEAGKKYYLKYYVGVLGRGYSQLSLQEGLTYLRDLNMGSNFKPLVIGKKPSITPLRFSNKPANLASKNDEFLKYDENTKTGVIKYIADMDNREIVLNKIEEVCNTKNITLVSDARMKIGAVYKTLDESVENNITKIQFQCLY